MSVNFRALESESEASEDMEIQSPMDQHEAAELQILAEAQLAYEEHLEQEEAIEASLSSLEPPPPPPPKGPCAGQCTRACTHILMCNRTRRRRQGFAGHSIPR